MLSRTASSLYWIGRHIERADFTVRIIEASQKFDLLPYSDGVSGMRSAFTASGAEYLYKGDLKNITAEEIIEFMVFSETNPSSIYSCLAKARHDARAVRTALTREVFETLNEAWLSFEAKKREIIGDNIQPFIDWIESIVSSFEGALQRTMLRNECFYFIRLGSALERADNTARIIDVKYHVLLPKHERVGGPIDEAQWTVLLRSVSAETAYRWIYREGLMAWHVAELMILNKEMPRSLYSCITIAQDMLNEITKNTGKQGAANRTARELHQLLKSEKIDNIINSGLHEFLNYFIVRNNDISKNLSEQFHF